MKVVEALKSKVAKDIAIGLATLTAVGGFGYWREVYLPGVDSTARTQLKQAKSDIARAAATDGFKVTEPVEDPWNVEDYTGRGGTLNPVGSSVLRHVNVYLDLGACNVPAIASTTLDSHNRIDGIYNFSVQESDATINFRNSAQLYRLLGANPCNALVERL